MLALNASTANSFFPYFTKMEARVEESECAQEETHDKIHSPVLQLKCVNLEEC